LVGFAIAINPKLFAKIKGRRIAAVLSLSVVAELRLRRHEWRQKPITMAVTAFGLEFGKAGNHRTQTLRAFSQTEMGAILNKVT
jgi:hypothetical protein